MNRLLTRKDSDITASTQRIEALSDGVFAIAITLLILEIKIPTHGELEHQSLVNYLVHLWPNYFAFVFSFIIIGIYWANHHYIFRLYTSTNHVFNILNVIFLMFISFLPFPTAIFGEYIADPEHRSSAITFYSIGIALPALMWYVLWLYASKGKRLIDKRLSDKFIRKLSRQYILSMVFYFSAILLSLYNSNISIILSISLTILYLSPPLKPEYEHD